MTSSASRACHHFARQALLDKPALAEQITQAIYAKRNAPVEAAK